MKKIAAILSSAVVLAALSSCAVTVPVNATSNPVGSKVGEAKTTAVFGVFHFDGGDASIREAAKKGGISTISTVDFQRKMGVFTTKYTTIVTGE